MKTGHYLVACPALNVREEVASPLLAENKCYECFAQSGSYSWVEDYLGHTHIEYGQL